MKISNKITEQLGKLTAGDLGSTPYLTGPKLVCGFDDIYGEGFPTRWRYSTDKIIESNGKPLLKNVLEEFVDPRRYGGDEEYVEIIVSDINPLIKYELSG